jgi:hypothetical protein
MAWAFSNWILCNVLSSVGICVITGIILFIIQWRFPKVFYGIVNKLFKIKRCVIDVNHKITKKNSELSRSHEKHRYIRRFISKMTNHGARAENNSTFRTDDLVSSAQSTTQEPTNNARILPSPDTFLDISNAEETNYKPNYRYQSEQNPIRIPVRINVKKRTMRQVVRSATEKTNQQKTVSSRSAASSANRYTTLSVPENHPAHPAYQREILNIYGKYLPLRKKRNRLLILVISTTVIASVIVAFCEGCLLASVTVYQGSPCPKYGDMDCFCGFNQTYFLCQTGNNIDFPSHDITGTCFRWIVRDQENTSVMTQIGVCAGLLTAFASITEVLLRILFYAYQRRPGVANGMRRVLEKTVGINNVTEPLCSCCIKFCFRVPPPNLGLYRYPIAVCLVTMGYISIAAASTLAYIPLIYFRVTLTSFTYIVLSSATLLCFFTMVWVVWEVDEFSRILPGGCMQIEEILKSQAFKNTKTLLGIYNPDDAMENISELGFPGEEESESTKKPAKTNSQTPSNGEEKGLTST